MYCCFLIFNPFGCINIPTAVNSTRLFINATLSSLIEALGCSKTRGDSYTFSSVADSQLLRSIALSVFSSYCSNHKILFMLRAEKSVYLVKQNDIFDNYFISPCF